MRGARSRRARARCHRRQPRDSGFTAPKLMWVREHEPQLFAQTARVLLPKDWLRLRLTGAYASDMSDASGTLWLDVDRRCWSEELLARAACTPGRCRASSKAVRSRACCATRWGSAGGLPAHVMVTGGAGDNAASAVGVGVVRPNQGCVSLGTSGVIFLSSDRRGDGARPARPAGHLLRHGLVGLSGARLMRALPNLTKKASPPQPRCASMRRLRSASTRKAFLRIRSTATEPAASTLRAGRTRTQAHADLLRPERAAQRRARPVGLE